MRHRKKIICFGVAFLLAVAGLFWPVDLKNTQLSPSLLASNGTLLHAYPAPDGQMRLPITLDQVDPVFIHMLLSYEDKRFDVHPGVDPFALGRAAYQWAKAGDVVSGGSTLTMQVARLLAPAPRTLTNKLLEIWRALRIETQYSKKEVLNFYLRLAPYGGNLAGIRAATLVYFNKEPAHLTPDEAALLVVLPQNPNGFRPDRFPEKAKAARAKILHRLFETKAISGNAFAAGMAASVPANRYDLPKLALNLSDFLLTTQPDQAPWYSTLDATLQKETEQRLVSQLGNISSKATIAAIIIENKTRAVKAYVGNADYFSAMRAGQIDMIRAIRSPGSTLKPFLYGLAFQDGFAVPETIIRDSQTRFGNYTPNNFNQGFTGDVTLRQALQQSLNIPAVKILNEYGPQRFLSKLQASGGKFVLSENKDAAELPIILGGLGTRLWDMATLYTGLANQGVVRPLHFLQKDHPAGTYRLLSNKSALQVTDILTGSALNDGVMRSPDLQQLAVKTGTSYGYRDAWSMGYTPDYTIGIWVGRPDGTSVPGQVGRSTAIPVLLSVYDALPVSLKRWPAVVPDMQELPDNLKRWIGDRNDDNRKFNNVASLTIHYPIADSVYQLVEIKDHGLKLTAQGGMRPYQWYVNGSQIQENEQDFIWLPVDPGYYKLTVQDTTGHSQTETIEVKE